MNLQKEPENEFRVGWCPICDQGWQAIIKDTVTGKLFVLCEECLSVWDDPKEIKIPQKALLDTYDLTENIPSYDEIEMAGWTRYLVLEK